MLMVDLLWIFEGFKGLNGSPVVYTSLSIRGLGLASRQGERGIDLTIEKHF